MIKNQNSSLMTRLQFFIFALFDVQAMQMKVQRWHNSYNNFVKNSVVPHVPVKFHMMTENISSALGVVVFEIIALAMYPIVFTSITSANVGGKVIGSNAVLVNLVPLFYAIILIAVPVGVAIKLLSSAT